MYSNNADHQCKPGPRVGYGTINQELSQAAWDKQQAMDTPRDGNTTQRQSHVMGTMSRLHKDQAGIEDALNRLEDALSMILRDPEAAPPTCEVIGPPRDNPQSTLHGELLAACGTAWTLENRLRNIIERLTL